MYKKYIRGLDKLNSILSAQHFYCQFFKDVSSYYASICELRSDNQLHKIYLYTIYPKKMTKITYYQTTRAFKSRNKRN